VKYLVEERHVDPNSCENEAKHSPLHLASAFGHLDIVRYLVEERNCHTECRTKNGNTSLHLAAQGGRLDTVKYLIKNI
jgi:ankyrin repeat protein